MTAASAAIGLRKLSLAPVRAGSPQESSRCACCICRAQGTPEFVLRRPPICAIRYSPLSIDVWSPTTSPATNTPSTTYVVSSEASRAFGAGLASMHVDGVDQPVGYTDRRATATSDLIDQN
jgi:hypothetical protein